MLPEPTLDFLSSPAVPALLPDDDPAPADLLTTRLKRSAYCMARLKCRDPLTGVMRTVSHPCREWHTCPRCRQYRTKLHKERIDRACQEGIVRWLITEPDRAKRLVRKYGKERVMRLPQEDGKVALFIATPDAVGVTVERQSPNWTRLMQTPDGEHISGSLGKLPEKDTPDDTVTIKQALYSVEGIPDEHLAHADRKAIDATRNLDPRTPAELEKAISRRDRLYLREAKKLGAKVTFCGISRTSVKLDSIRWEMTLPETIRLVKEANSGPATEFRPYRTRPEYLPVSDRQAIIDREKYLNGR